MYIARGDRLPSVREGRDRDIQQAEGWRDIRATVDLGDKQKFMSTPGNGPWFSI